MKRILAAMLAALTVFSTAGCAKPDNSTEPVTPDQQVEPAPIVPQEPVLTPEEQAEQAENTAEFAGKRLLVVEDNALNCEIAVTMLEEAGFTVETAENGKLAVDKVRENAPGY